MSQCNVNTKQGRGILLATILASGMSFLLSTSTSVALPVIQAEFSARISDIQWVFNAFALALAALLLIGGSLGDHYGRKKIFSLGIVIFSLGALLSGLAGTIEHLILFQALTGIGAAMMIPGSLAIINHCFAPAERGRAIGLWAGLSGGLAALGPFLGGWLVESSGWPAVFFINVPFGILAFLVALKVVPESRNEQARKLDIGGTIFILLGLLGLSVGLIQGPISGWQDALVVTSLVVGVTALVLFVLTELKVREPMVPFKLFKNPLVAGANLVTLFLYFALNGVIFFIVLNFQQVQGFSPIFAGLGLLPPIMLITFLSGPAGSLADRRGPRGQMILGPLIVAIGMGLLILPGAPANYFSQFLPGLVLFGLGMALVIAPLTKSAMAVPDSYSGVASGVNNAVSRLAALLAVAVLGVLVVSIFRQELEQNVYAAQLDKPEQAAIMEQSDQLAGISIPDYFNEAATAEAQLAVNSSFVAAFRWAMGVAAALALLSSITAYFTIRPKGT